MKEYDVEHVSGFHLQQKVVQAMNDRAQQGWRVAFVNVGDNASAWITFERDIASPQQ